MPIPTSRSSSSPAPVGASAPAATSGPSTSCRQPPSTTVAPPQKRSHPTNMAPQSLLLIKRQLYADLFRDLDTAAAEAEQLMEDQIGSPEFKEGVAAFQAKRPPNFPLLS